MARSRTSLVTEDVALEDPGWLKLFAQAEQGVTAAKACVEKKDKLGLAARLRVLQHDFKILLDDLEFQEKQEQSRWSKVA